MHVSITLRQIPSTQYSDGEDWISGLRWGFQIGHNDQNSHVITVAFHPADETSHDNKKDDDDNNATNDNNNNDVTICMTHMYGENMHL